MRRSLAVAGLLASLLAAACSDHTGPSQPGLVAGGVPMAKDLAGDIDAMILQFFPKGLETSTGTRWLNIKLELGTWNSTTKKWTGSNVTQGQKHLVDLSKFILSKTGDVEGPTLCTALVFTNCETKSHAANRLLLAMNVYVFQGPSATLTEPTPTTDMTVVFVPAGQAATVQAPSHQAGVSLPTGSTSEDRFIAVVRSSGEFAKCAGPLATTRCQYPLYFRMESYPPLPLNSAGHFAVCMEPHGSGAPLDYPEQQDVHERMRLAHQDPALHGGRRTPGSQYQEGLEILPLVGVDVAGTQGNVATCIEEAFAPTHDGLLGLGQKALYAVGKMLTPKNLYAYDQGPEHLSTDFSDFNGVDPSSTPDLSVASLSAPSSTVSGSDLTVSYTVENRSRSNGGGSTGASPATSVTAWLSTSGTIDEGAIRLGSANVPALAPDGSFPVSHTITAPAAGEYFVIVQVDAVTLESNTENNTASQALAVNAAEIPSPILAYRHSEQYSTGPGLDWDRYTLTVTNRASYPASMFSAAPDLPPCGLNTSASQSWVDIYNGSTNNRIYGFCGLGSPNDLNDIWVAVTRWTDPPSSLYITITDRRANVVYTSNTINLYGPLFVNYPRAVSLSWPAVAGAASYEIEVDYCESWASPDWRNCTGGWLPLNHVLANSGTSYLETFVGDQPGRWHVRANDASGNPISAYTAYKFFNYRTGPSAP